MGKILGNRCNSGYDRESCVGEYVSGSKCMTK